jgi:hypothetical protein
MTPLVAGIALTGKAPVYENVYMSGLKQKAAGEAAKAKQLSDAEKEYQKALGAGSDKVIPSLVQRHEKAGLAFLAGSEEVLRNNPVNGINQVNRNFFQTKEQLNNLIQQSDEVRKRLAPGYYDKFIAPPKLLAALQSTKDIEEAYKDPSSGLQEEAAKLGYELSFDPSGRVGIVFNDIPKVDVVKDYFNWQRKTVYDSDATLGNNFTAGRASRQEIERVVTPQASERVLSSLSGNRVFAANWDALGYDVTTPDGRTRIYNDYLAPKVDSFTSGGGFTISVNNGGQVESSPVVSQTSLNADTGFNWTPSSRPDASGDYYVLEFMKEFGDKNLVLGDGKGNPIRFKTRQEADDYLLNNSKFEYEAIQTLNLDVPAVGITIPSGQKSFTIGEEGSNTGYGEAVQSNTFNMRVNRLESAETYTGDKTLTIGLFRLEKGDIIPKKLFNNVPTNQREKKVFVVGEVETSYKTNVGTRDKGGTVYVPATKQNISAIISKLPPAEKETRKMLEDINSGKQKLGEGKIIGAATKGAGKQTGAEAPQSTFNLLDIPTA